MSRNRDTEKNKPAEWIFPLGEMAEMIRTKDWSVTPLGALESWPLPLKTVTNLVLSNSFANVILWGPELTLVYNDAYRVIAGDRHPQALGRSTKEIWPETWEFNKPILDDVMQEGKTFHFEDHLFRVRRNTGIADAWFTLSYGPIWLEDGTVGGTLVTLQETTSRKQHEQLLNEKAKHAKLFETLPLGVVFHTADGKIVDANPAAEEILGLTLDQMQGRTSIDPRWKAIHEDGSPFPGEEHPAMVTLATGTPQRNIVMGIFHPKENAHRWILVSSTPLLRPGEVKPWQVFTTFADITGRRQAEEALGRSNRENAKLADFLRYSAQPCGIGSPDGRIDYVNPAFEQLVGYTRLELQNLDWVNMLTPPEWRERESLQLAMLNQTGKPARYEKEYIRKDGSRVPVELLVHLVTGEKGLPECYFTYITDITDRKRRELSDWKERHVLTEGQKIAHLGIFEYVAATRETVWSEEEYRIYGLDPTGPSPSYEEHLIRCIHPEDAQKLQATFSAAMAQRTVFENENRIIRPDGTIRWVFNRAHPYFDERGNLLRYIGTTLDITDRKKAEEDVGQLNANLERLVEERTNELRISREKYRALVENLSDCIWETDPEGRFTYLSPAFSIITGFDAKEFLGKTPFDLLPADGSHQAAQMISASIAARQEFSLMELVIRHRDGTRVAVQISGGPMIGPDGQFRGIRGMTRNITERKMAEAALQSSEEKHRMIFDLASDVILIIAENGKILQANALACVRLGYTREEMTAMTIAQLDSPEEAPHIPERMAKIREQGAAVFETTHLCKDGAHIPIEANARMISWDGRPAILSLCRDITARKKAEAEMKSLEAQNLQLRKADSLGRMAAAIAHHFNNQLQVVSGYLEVILGELPPDAGSLTRIMTKALQATQKASLVSRSMLTYLGQTVAPKEPHDLSEICKRVLPLLSVLITERSGLMAELHSPGPIARLNPDQIQQVLVNLINNALEATVAAPSKIGVSITTVESPVIQKEFLFPLNVEIPSRPYACLEVHDDGCGIPAEDVERIFDPFFTTKFPGRGMGLAMVGGIVRAHEGFITVKSEPGHGSTFRVYLPLHEAGLPVAQPSPTAPRKIQSGGQVLLVEDDEMVRNMAAQMLKMMGFSVLTASDGVEAVHVFRQNPDQVRLVLCDVSMPRMDGWETLAELRKLSPGLPVILASGYSEAQVMAKAHVEQPQAFLGKPFQKSQLEKAIAQALAGEKS